MTSWGPQSVLRYLTKFVKPKPPN